MDSMIRLMGFLPQTYRQKINVCCSKRPPESNRVGILDYMKKEYTEYLKVRKNFISKSSYVTYRRCLEIADHFFDKPLCEITDSDISDFKNWLDRVYSPKYTKTVFIVLKTFFKFWHGDVDCLNPARIPVPKGMSKRRYTIKEYEYDKLLESLSPQYPIELQRTIILRLLWETGARINEICAMKFEDIAKRKATVNTEKSLYQRYIFWSEETDKLLKRYLALRENVRRGEYIFIGFGKHGKRFTTSSRRLTSRTLERWLKNQCGKAGVSCQIVPHSFRHACIQRWLDAGMNPYEVIQLSGHTNTLSLHHYLRYGVKKNEVNAMKAMG